MLPPLKTKRISFMQGLSTYLAVNIFHFGCKNNSVNTVLGKFTDLLNELTAMFFF